MRESKDEGKGEVSEGRVGQSILQFEACARASNSNRVSRHACINTSQYFHYDFLVPNTRVEDFLQDNGQRW